MFLFWLSVALAAKKPAPLPPPPPPPEPDTPFAAGMKAVMDLKADPCKDFYQYACGGWTKATPLPPDRPIVTRGFTTIQDANEETLHKLLEADMADSGGDAGKQKLGAYYKSCMDTSGIDAKAATAVQPYLSMIDTALKGGKKKYKDKYKPTLMKVVGQLQADGFGPFLGFGIDGDAKNPGTVILQLTQGGTGLPDKSYYTDPQYQSIRDEYQQHAKKLFELAGWSDVDATQAAADVLAFETSLAAVQWTPEQQRDATLTYNKLDRTGLEGITAGLDWAGFFTGLGHADLTAINVMEPSYFEGTAKLIAATPVPMLATYLKWNVLNNSANELAKPFDDESFRFYGQVLNGQKQQRDRWKRCVASTDFALGDLLAAQFVDAAFPGESKPVALDMVGRIEGAFEQGLPSLTWMDPETQAKAVEKARAVQNKIGFPAHWREYPFEVKADDYYGDNRRAARNFNDWQLSKVGKPVDPDNWLMTAPTVNAYYNPSANEIVFPAGILQPPFFSADFPKAWNFGAMGMVIGHELTHGFDDEGRKFDGTGKLTDWWAADAVQKFEGAADCVSKQYDTYQVLPASGDTPEVKVNGGLTLGENIADLGGTRIAYRAYQKWVADNGAEQPVGGLDPNKLFFVALAQGWCTVAAPEVQRVRAATDPHSPPRYRINGTLTNVPEFAAAFQCAEGTPMHPAQTCQVW